MSVNVLVERAKVLQAEIGRAKQHVMSSAEQLDQAKIHLNQVTGHFNEVAYLLGEAQKEEQSKLSQDNLGGQGDGDANKQEQEQTAKE